MGFNQHTRAAAFFSLALSLLSIFGLSVAYWFLFTHSLQQGVSRRLHDKYIQVRGGILWKAHVFGVHGFGAVIHPMILFAVNWLTDVTKARTTALWCYWAFVFYALHFILLLRFWKLYFDFSFKNAQLAAIWQTKLLAHDTMLVELSTREDVREAADSQCASARGINDRHRWFLASHRTWGNLRVFGLRLALPFIILLILQWCYAIFWNGIFSVYWHLILVVISLVTVCFIFRLLIELHRVHVIDNFALRSEFDHFFTVVFVLLFGAAIVSVVIGFLSNGRLLLRLWIVSIFVQFMCLATTCSFVAAIVRRMYESMGIRVDVNDDSLPQTELSDIPKKVPSTTSSMSSSNTLSLEKVLLWRTGINTFAPYLVNEFCIENLLFLIEVSQFRKQMDPFAGAPHLLGASSRSLLGSPRVTPPVASSPMSAGKSPRSSKSPRYSFRRSLSFATSTMIASRRDEDSGKKQALTAHDLVQDMFIICPELPLCASVADFMDDAVAQASLIRKKFMSPNSGFDINVQQQIKGNVMAVDLEALYAKEEKKEFYKIFDEAYLSVLNVINDPYIRFTDTPEFEVLEAKYRKADRSDETELLRDRTTIHMFIHGIGKKLPL